MSNPSFLKKNDQFQTYVQFQPNGGIPVTIGLINWSWNGDVEQAGGVWGLSSSNIGMPQLSPSDAFPVWTQIFGNTGH
jgi:hypothetical protein